MNPKATHLTWHRGSVSAEDRARLLGHGAAVLWLTGLSGSGKSTLCRALEEALIKEGALATVLDGDNLRHGLNADLGFAPADRRENIRRVGEVARLLYEAGAIVLVAFISPYREDRDRARTLLPEGRFLEVHLATPLEVCEARDPKGLYQKAREGTIRGFTGIDAPYEAPEDPELSIDTSSGPLSESVAELLSALRARGILPEAAQEP
jgi:adenylylsulfate kinase